jgi:hypothetical protein
LNCLETPVTGRKGRGAWPENVPKGQRIMMKRRKDGDRINCFYKKKEK